ncbi:uncharacterized protein LOC124938003 [Impatiens glandulifera]|uniref:uncharacterized protein LOC124938003 n=1 Tax=Impatiens glandulifera TaxID=253017 RepID=UPI001FB1418A|nr:uncharacterized protein LOC124938003 [Impatiens glandulifera]XP_047334312.1 uncharacterized protein LOC124938003 [Impatiens glandulifera]
MERNDDSGSPSWSASFFMQTKEDVAKAVAAATAASTYVHSPRPSGIYSPKDENGSSSLKKLQQQVYKVLKGFSQQPEVRRGTYNPEDLTSQKRQWARFQLQHLDNKALKEPSRIFESMVVVGLPPSCDVEALQKQYFGRKPEGSGKFRSTLTSQRQSRVGPNLEPQVLFVYPPEKQLPLKYKDLLSFCLPGGVEVHAVEKTPSMSELNEILLGQEHLKQSDQSFVFRLQVADDSTLYGCCVLVEEIVQKPSPLISMLSDVHYISPTLSRYVLTTHRCYCILSRLPFFELHFGVLNSLFAEERLERLTKNIGILHMESEEQSEHEISGGGLYKEMGDGANKQLNETTVVSHLNSNGHTQNDKNESCNPHHEAVDKTNESCKQHHQVLEEIEHCNPHHQVVEGINESFNPHHQDVVEIKESCNTHHQCNGDVPVNHAEQCTEKFPDKTESGAGTPVSESSDVCIASVDFFVANKQALERCLPSAVLPLLRHQQYDSFESCSSFQGSPCEDRIFRSDIDDVETEEASSSGQGYSSYYSDILKWAKANNQGSLQIICEYYHLKCPSRGSTIRFHPLEHLHPLEYHRPDETTMRFTGSRIGLSTSRTSLELVEAHSTLLAEEEATALSVWAVACLCGSLRLEHVLTFFAGALLEKQILVICSNLGLLSASVLSVIPLIRPYRWQSLLMPVLPDDILDFLDAPVPYIVGVKNKTMEVQSKLTNVILVDANKNQVKSSAIPNLPYQKELYSSLSPYHAKLVGESFLGKKRPIHGCTDVQVEAAKGFLGVLRTYLDNLCSNLRSHTITNVQSNDDKVSLLLKESFIESFSYKDRPFMRLLVDTQLFSVHTDSVLSFIQKE